MTPIEAIKQHCPGEPADVNSRYLLHSIVYSYHRYDASCSHTRVRGASSRLRKHSHLQLYPAYTESQRSKERYSSDKNIRIDSNR